MSHDTLLNSETLLLQAQKVAHELLTQHEVHIQPQKKEWLADFARRSKGKRLRLSITNKECYAVLNFAKTVNRQTYKQRRRAAA